MIVNNAAARRDVDFWTKHLENIEQNERAELKQVRGVRADTLREALLEMKEQARVAPKCQNFMYHADFNPCPHEHLTEADWERAFEIFEEKRSIPAGQPRIVQEHEKNGRVHRHVIWLRVDLETGRAFPDGLDAKIAHAAARQIEKELDLQRVIGPYDREEGTPRPPRAPEPWEMYRGMKTSIDPRDVTAEVTELRQQCGNGIEFHAALETRGYILARGDKIVAGEPTLMIIDSAGNDHHLPRRLAGMKSHEVSEFMRAVDREALPTIRQAQEQQRQRHLDQLEADRATVRDEIEWHEALAKAAIEKEQREPQFIAAEDREIEARAGAGDKQPAQQPETWDRDQANQRWEDAVLNAAIEQEKTAGLFIAPAEAAHAETRAGGKGKEPQQTLEKQPAPELGKTQAQIRLARGLSPGPQSFATALEDRGFILASVTDDDIQKDLAKLREEWEERRRNPQSWMEHEGGYAALPPEFQESARRSFDEWQQRKQQGEPRQRQTKPFTPDEYLTRVQKEWAEALGQSPATQKNESEEKELQKQLEDYVDFVQRKSAEGPKSQLERATGGLAVVTPIGSVFTLTPRNTGLSAEELPHYLKGIDTAPLLSVTEARAVIEDVREHRRKDWQHRHEEWLMQRPIGATAAGIRLAYGLTRTGPEFAGALEDRGLMLACMTEADVERLNRWERQRLREEWAGPAPEKSIQSKERDIENYNKYQAGELVVINQSGHVFQMTAATTGAHAAEREERLKDIDRAALMDVTAAQIAMKEFRQHQRQEWRQQREDNYRQGLNEKVSPVSPPRPERQSASLFAQAASEAAGDHRTEDLRGVAAEVWDIYRRAGNEYYFDAMYEATLRHSMKTGDCEAFAAALDERGITFARVTKEEAETSHRQAAFAREIDNYAPRYREGEIVIVTEPGLERLREGEWTESRRVHRLDPSLAEKFVKTLGITDKLQSIEATLNASDERAERRREEREEAAFERMEAASERAADILDRAQARAGKEAKVPGPIRKAPARVIGGAFDVGMELAGLAFSFDAPKSRRLQERENRDGERAVDRRNVEADQQIDFSKYTAENAQRQRNEQEQQAARDRQREHERER